MAPQRGGTAGAGEGRLRNEMPKPVRGRLQAFGPEWERLTSDVWVLQTIKTGYRIEFTGPCRLTRSAMWTRIPTKESHRLAMETGLQKMLEKRAIKIVDPLLLLFPLFSGEEIRRLEAHFKPEGIKRRGDTPVVQNGYPSVRPSITRRGYPPIPDSKYTGLGPGHVGRHSRLRGRLLRVRRYHLRVPSLAVRPFYGPKNVHTSGTGRRRLPQDVRGQSVPVPGQLARGRRVIRPNPTIPIPGPYLHPGNRVPRKRGEIRLGPDPVPVLPSLQPGPSQGSGPSIRRPHRPAPSTDRTAHERRIVHSPSVEIPVWTSGEHDVSGPKSKTTHPPSPVLRPEPMVPGHARHNPDTPDPECPGPTRVVVRPHQLDFRSSFLHSRPGTNNSDRCFILRMGRSPGRPDGFWRLARPMEEQTHQLV